MKKRGLLVYHFNENHHQDPWKALGQRYALWFTRNLATAISYLTSEHIACILTKPSLVCHSPVNEVFYFQTCFQTVPILIYGIPEAAFQEGLADGPVRFLPHGSFNRLLEEIPSLILHYSFSPDLGLFGISLEQCPARIKKALGLIQRNFLDKNLCVSQIAFQLNVHRCHFEREFQHYCKVSPKQLIIGLRLFFACFLMKNQGMKLLHVAQLAGFPDYYEFCKSFHNHMSMTPREFRFTCSEKDFHRHFQALSRRSCNKTTTNITL